MKIMRTMASEAQANRPKRRFYSAELKAQVMWECRQSSASVAGAALSHGINANIVHRWLREPTPSALVPRPQANAFVPVTLDEAAPDSTPQSAFDIRVASTPRQHHRRREVAAAGWRRLRRLVARVAAMIRIDALRLATEPMDMRAGTDTALARVVKVFGAAHPHQAYLFANPAGQPDEGIGA